MGQRLNIEIKGFGGSCSVKKTLETLVKVYTNFTRVFLLQIWYN